MASFLEESIDMKDSYYLEAFCGLLMVANFQFHGGEPERFAEILSNKLLILAIVGLMSIFRVYSNRDLTKAEVDD